MREHACDSSGSAGAMPGNAMRSGSHTRLALQRGCPSAIYSPCILQPNISSSLPSVAIFGYKWLDSLMDRRRNSWMFLSCFQDNNTGWINIPSILRGSLSVFGQEVLALPIAINMPL
jgi:hypothetical protein